MTRAITITSGKGGVGKTNISLNLALQLSTLGHKTCLFDADLGLANINILLGIRPSYDIHDLIHNKQPLATVLFSTQGIDILPGSSGVEELANLNHESLSTLIHSLAPLSDYDYLLFDTSAGIAKNVIAFCLSCPETIMVITPEPTSLTDAFSLLKVLAANSYKGDIKVVINQCEEIKSAKKVYKRFKDAVDQFIGLKIEPLGVVYKDPKLTEAVSRQVPFIKLFPDTIASKCLRKIAERLLENKPEQFEQETIGFWQKCLRLMANPLELTGSKHPPPEPIKILDSNNTPSPAAIEPELQSESAPKPSPVPLPPADVQSPSAPLPLSLNLEPAIALLAQAISDGIGSLSSEVKGIRQELLNGKKDYRMNHSDPPADQEGGAPPKVEPIPLDLNAYLTRKK